VRKHRNKEKQENTFVLYKTTYCIISKQDLVYRPKSLSLLSSIIIIPSINYRGYV